MIGWIKKALGGSKVDYSALIAQGAKIIDVRTPGEYAQGHAKGSIDIPLDQIAKKASSLKKEQTYIMCCVS